MISRRNIRVKVMQTLYTVESQLAESNMEETPGSGAAAGSGGPGKTPPGKKSFDPVKLLQNHFDQTRQLFIFLIHTLSEVALYAETDARNRASKHLPTAQDLNVNTKIARNDLLQKILDLPSYKLAIKEIKPQHLDNPELLR